ncbi:MAG: SRPBCC domain-containing protein [Pseudomonadota bacterium]
MSETFLQSAPDDATVVVEGVFDHPVDRVFRAWTDPEQLLKWFGPEEGALLAVDADPRVGGRVRFEFRTTENLRSAVEGSYLAIDPDERLVFSWSHILVRQDGAEERTPVSTVTVTFQPAGDGTRITLRHEGIKTRGGRDGVSAGWSSAFARLLKFVTSGKATTE